MVEKKNECPKDYILRDAYHRDAYMKCPPKHKGCSPNEMIVIPATDISATCVPDVGKQGKTPESDQWLPQLEKGGLSQYFDEETMAYDKEACLKAGIRAKKWGKKSKRQFQGRFRAMVNVNANRPKIRNNFRICERNAVIGFTGQSINPETQEMINKLKKEIANEP